MSHQIRAEVAVAPKAMIGLETGGPAKDWGSSEGQIQPRTYRGGPCQRDRILYRISDPIFGSYPATLFSQQRAYKLANVSHTLVSKVETIAVCERERVAHVCCAALAQCMPVHAHCCAHACSVPQEERKSQCTICQSCNLKLPRRCQSNTQFCVYSSSKPTSDSDLRSALSLKCLPRVASSLRGTAFV